MLRIYEKIQYIHRHMAGKINPHGLEAVGMSRPRGMSKDKRPWPSDEVGGLAYAPGEVLEGGSQLFPLLFAEVPVSPVAVAPVQLLVQPRAAAPEVAHGEVRPGDVEQDVLQRLLHCHLGNCACFHLDFLSLVR